MRKKGRTASVCGQNCDALDENNHCIAAGESQFEERPNHSAIPSITAGGVIQGVMPILVDRFSTSSA
jgi:hypothetical protein